MEQVTDLNFLDNEGGRYPSLSAQHAGGGKRHGKEVICASRVCGHFSRADPDTNRFNMPPFTPHPRGNEAGVRNTCVRWLATGIAVNKDIQTHFCQMRAAISS